MASKERANPRSANVSTVVKSPLDSLARYAVRYIISSASARERTKPMASLPEGLNTVDAPGMCEWFHTPEKFCEIDRNRSPPRGGCWAERKLYTGIRSACCADSPRGTVELRNWLKEPLATRGSPLDHFDAVLATASSMHALTCEYLIMDGSRHRKSALTDVGR
jgi:hypothetical protein